MDNQQQNLNQQGVCSAPQRFWCIRTRVKWTGGFSITSLRSCAQNGKARSGFFTGIVNRVRITILILPFFAQLGVVIGGPASAQSYPAVGKLEEVMVTAQKREQDLQSVPQILFNQILRLKMKAKEHF